jgi:hypothetical protein
MRTARMHQTSFVVAGALLAALAVTPDFALAQGTSKSKGRTTRTSAGSVASAKVPPGQMPRLGQCRVWVDGLPAGRQAAATTDCEAAMREAAATPGARVLYGRVGGKRGGVATCENQRHTYPTTAPLMSSGAQWTAGTSSTVARRWHLSDGYTLAVNDFNNDGTPETVAWLLNGQYVQVWHNPDGDTTADIVEIFCNGTEVAQFVY